LLYDNNVQAPVDFIEQVPLTYKTKISKEKMTATIDVTILVLSSQLENSLFLIKIRAENKKDSEDFSECISIPIKVVSKVTQLHTKAKKRTRNRSTPTKDMFIIAMEKLDNGQEKHSQLLATLLEQSKQQTQVLQLLLQDEAQEIVNTINQDEKILDDFSLDNAPNKRIKVEVTEDQNDGKSSIANNQLDFAFKNLFESFSTLDDDIFEKAFYQQSSSCSNSNNQEMFPFSFDEEVINSESPNHILSYDHSDELIDDDMHLVSDININIITKDKCKNVNESIDFGAFPNLFFENNYL